jgi:hypothetical protein
MATERMFARRETKEEGCGGQGQSDRNIEGCLNHDCSPGPRYSIWRGYDFVAPRGEMVEMPEALAERNVTPEELSRRFERHARPRD